ncbi:MAG: SpaH/EbpB family LPXTG-anchored major pilin [Lachnospiraceae bacterium]|nr:SpaH/EbpB family LPXTG-anchored major pilin [Lachnospiraceae bacterium]
MKRTLKKLAALASAAIMALGMTTTALAADVGGADSYTITITGSSAGATEEISGNTYSVFKLAAFDVEDLQGQKVYTNITALAPFADLQDDIEGVSGKGSTDTETLELAEAAAKIALENTSQAVGNTTIKVDEGVVSNNSVTVTGKGYYLIVETAHGSDNVYLSTKYLLVAIEESKEVEVKVSTPTVTKKIVSEHDSTGNTLEDADTVANGDTVTYQLQATIPEYDSDATNQVYQLVDTLSTGLTFDSITSITIGATTYTVGGQNDCTGWIDTEEVATTGGGSFTITIPSDIVVDNADQTVTVLFTAELNTSANVGEEGNPNSVHLVYSHNYYGDGSSTTTTTKEDTVITYTGLITIKKVSSDASSTALEGAEFDIYKVVDSSTSGATALTVPAEAGETETGGGEITEKTVYVIKVDTITTTTDGTASTKGRDVGTYYAVETKAPTGYTVDDTPFKISLKVESTALTLDSNGDASTTVTDFKYTDGATANSTTVSNYKVTWKTNGDVNNVEITNDAGLSLPGTGGIGTTLFTFGGLALVILAAVMFIVYTKKQRKQA